MPRLRHTVGWALAGATTTVVLLVLAMVLLTRTQLGIELTGRYVVERIQASVNGELEVAAIRGRGLLRGVTLDGVRITGPDGRLFLHADSARLTYNIRTLLGGDIAFNGLTLYRPEVHVERLPGVDAWNFQIIFPDDPDAPEAREAPANIVFIENATVHDGYVAVRMPWDPAMGGDTERMLIEDVPGGWVRTVRFTELNGRLPQILWQAPTLDGRVIRIGEMSGLAYLWDTPAEILELRGTVTLRDSVVTFQAPHVRLPESELSALGQVIVGEKLRRYDIEVQGDQLALRDFRWLYPTVPEEGSGSLRFRIQTQPGGETLWLASDARLSTPGSEISGTFGVVTGDTIYFSNVSLRAAPLDLELVRRLLPVDLPVDGLLIGTVEVDGPVSLLRTRGDLRHEGLAAGARSESAVRWTGWVRAQPPYAVRALDADIRRLDLAQVAEYAPELRLRGGASGRVRVDGSMERGFDVTGRLSLEHGGALSAVRGEGRLLAANGRSEMDVRLDAEPLALTLLSAQYPALARLGGAATGPVRLAGSFQDMRLDADLSAGVGGIQLDGRLELAEQGVRYRTRGRLDGFRLDQVVVGLAETSLTGVFELDAGPGPLHEIAGRFAAELTGGSVGGVEIYGGSVSGSMAGGLARVDSLIVRAPVGRLRAAGTVGLVAGRNGALDFALTAESLAPLEGLLFDGPVGDAAVLGDPRVAGAVTATGSVTGSIVDWRVRGRVDGRHLRYDRVAGTRLTADVEWSRSRRTVEVRADSVRAWGRIVPHLHAMAGEEGETGRVRLRADGPGTHAVALDGRFHRLGGGVAVEVGDLTLAAGTGRWDLADTFRATLARDGLTLSGLVLRRAEGDAEIAAAGVIPWRQPGSDLTPPADFGVELQRLPVGELAALFQTGQDVDGVLTARLNISGAASAPVIDGMVSARPFRYEAAVLDSVGGGVAYRDRLLTGSLVGWRDGRAIAAADAVIPVELALTPHEDRLLDRPIHVGLRADGMPAGLVAFLVPGLTQVGGTVDGSMVLSGVVGHGGRPALEGSLRLTRGSAFVEPLNVRFHDATGVARMGDGSIVQVDLRARGEAGTVEVRGSLEMDRPTDPGLDLHIAARRLEATRRRDVTAVGDGDVHLGGRYTRPVLSGSVRLITGELNLDEVLRQYQIVQLDTSLFSIFDAGTIPYRIEPLNPFIENLVLSGFTLSVDRNVWLRSQELNVEVAGVLGVTLDRQFNDIRLTGTMAALRGTYQLQVLERVPTRRFEIRQGSIHFPGTPGIDPNLNIIASHRVRRAQGDPLDVVATLTGTLQSPRVRLSSDSDPPVSETDIASFLLFGRSTLELSQTESDVVASMREGMLGLARPIFLGLASSQLQQAAANLGLPVDYLALTAPEYGFGDYSQVMNVHGGLGVLQGTQLEAGFYAHRDIFVLGSFTPFARALGSFAETEPLFHPRFGARVEWRFRPTWTMEMYWEDRFARTPSFGFDHIHDRTVGGLSVFRDWGY